MSLEAAASNQTNSTQNNSLFYKSTCICLKDASNYCTTNLTAGQFKNHTTENCNCTIDMNRGKEVCMKQKVSCDAKKGNTGELQIMRKWTCKIDRRYLNT